MAVTKSAMLVARSAAFATFALMSFVLRVCASTAEAITCCFSLSSSTTAEMPPIAWIAALDAAHALRVVRKS